MRDRAVVALVGERLLKTPGVPGRALSALSEINVEMISLGANEINLSLVVEQGQAAEAQRRLHAAFFEN
jgi:aspartate kinase